MDFQSLITRLQNCFTNQYKTEIEQFITSRNPKTTADVESLIQQFNYQSKWPNA